MSVMCLLPFSCSLEEETRTEVEKKNYMNNAEEAKDVLLGVYRTNTLDAMYGYYLSILTWERIFHKWKVAVMKISVSFRQTHSQPLSLKYSKHGQHFIPVFTEQMIFWNVSQIK